MADEKQISKNWLFTTTRFYIVLITMFTIFCSIVMRDNMSISIVCMTNSSSSGVSYKNNSTTPQAEVIKTIIKGDKVLECPKWSLYNNDHTKKPKIIGTFNWTPSMQSWLFSIVFYGSFVTVLYSGYLSDKYGPKIVVSIGITGYMILNFLLPTAAKVDFYLLLGIRLIMGILEGFIQPSLTAMISRWFPVHEKSTAAAIYTSGFQLGSGFIAAMGSKLCALTFLDGWPLIFYMSGCFGVVCLILWTVFISNSPDDNRIISEEEKEYLINQITIKAKTKNFYVPWYEIFTSKAVLAILFSGFALTFESDLMMSFLPSYMRDTLKIGTLTAIPFVSLLISKNIVSIIIDKLKQSGLVSLTTSSKLCQASAAFGTSATLLLMALFVDCTQPVLAIILLVFYGITYAGFVPGTYTSLLSVAPQYTGILASLYSFSGMFAKIVSPTIVGIVNKTGSRQEWAIVFFICSSLNILAGLIFAVFGSAEVQKWSQINFEEKKSIHSDKDKKKDKIYSIS